MQAFWNDRCPKTLEVWNDRENLGTSHIVIETENVAARSRKAWYFLKKIYHLHPYEYTQKYESICPWKTVPMNVLSIIHKHPKVEPILCQLMDRSTKYYNLYDKLYKHMIFIICNFNIKIVCGNERNEEISMN